MTNHEITILFILNLLIAFIILLLSFPAGYFHKAHALVGGSIEYFYVKPKNHTKFIVILGFLIFVPLGYLIKKILYSKLRDSKANITKKI